MSLCSSYMMLSEKSHPGTVESSLHGLGARLARIRLARNLTQANLARESGTSVASIKRIEAGENASLDTFIRVLTALRLANRLETFLPDPDVRPVERVKRGHERQRARGHAPAAKVTEWAWGEDADE